MSVRAQQSHGRKLICVPEVGADSLVLIYLGAAGVSRWPFGTKVDQKRWSEDEY